MNKKKSLKTVISFILTLTLAFSLSFTAFAAEQNDLGNYTYEHPRANTIEYCIEPGGTLNFSDDNGIMPLVWNQLTTTLVGNYSTTTPNVPIPDRYMAYEIYATDINGNTVNGNYTVILCQLQVCLMQLMLLGINKIGLICRPLIIHVISKSLMQPIQN